MTGFAAAVLPLLDEPDDDVLLLAVVEEPELELDDPLDPMEEEPLDPEEELLDPEEELPLLLAEPPDWAVLDDPAFFFILDFELLLPDVSPPCPLPPEPLLPPCEPDAPPDEPWAEPPPLPPAALPVAPCVELVVPSKASTLHRTGVVIPLSTVPFSTTTTSISP
jgi:hypothetical protein